jgi:hypothetical protein
MSDGAPRRVSFNEDQQQQQAKPPASPKPGLRQSGLVDNTPKTSLRESQNVTNTNKSVDTQNAPRVELQTPKVNIVAPTASPTTSPNTVTMPTVSPADDQKSASPSVTVTPAPKPTPTVSVSAPTSNNSLAVSGHHPQEPQASQQQTAVAPQTQPVNNAPTSQTPAEKSAPVTAPVTQQPSHSTAPSQQSTQSSLGVPGISTSFEFLISTQKRICHVLLLTQTFQRVQVRIPILNTLKPSNVLLQDLPIFKHQCPKQMIEETDHTDQFLLAV